MDEIKQLIAAMAAETLPLSIPPTELAEILNRLADYLDDSLSENYKFVGIATQSGSPVESQYPVFYLAGPGRYPNYGNTVVPAGCLGVFLYNTGRWRYPILDIASSLGTSSDAANATGSAFARIAYIKNALDKVNTSLTSLANEPSLHDLWLKAGATYQAETNTYTLNGVSGLTKVNMLSIWYYGKFIPSTSAIVQGCIGDALKTNFPHTIEGYTNVYLDGIDLYARFNSCFQMKVIQFLRSNSVTEDKLFIRIADMRNAFNLCTSLTDIKNIIDVGNITEASKLSNSFGSCTKLQNVRIRKLKVSLSFAASPNLTVKDDTTSTLGYLIENSENTSNIQITLHPDAFVRLEEGLIQKAQAKQITIASA